MLPIIVAGAALALLAGKKKKKPSAGKEPDYGPGMGAGDGRARATAGTRWADLTEAQKEARLDRILDTSTPLTFSATSVTPEDVEKEVEDDEKKNPPNPPTIPDPESCRKGTISGDKRYVCWYQKGAKGKWGKPAWHRIAPVKAAKAAAAAGILTPGFVLSTVSPGYNFAYYCWSNRKRLYKRTCKKRWKVGKKKCRRFEYKRY